MKFKPCSKCGALNNAKQSKHVAVNRLGKNWCGHCGAKLTKA